MIDLNRYIQLQCERTAPGLLNEPFNLFTGLLFLLVSYKLLKILYQHEQRPFSLKFLSIMAGLIGVGSMTYHSFSRMWAAIFADAMPIMITALVLFYMLTKHILRLSTLGGLLLLVIFVVMNIVFKKFLMHAPDGYFSLIPTLVFLVLISVYMIFTKNISARDFALASLMAILGLFFRVLDTFVCSSFPIGTHFLWHSFMAIFFFIVIRETIRRHTIYDSPKP